MQRKLGKARKQRYTLVSMLSVLLVMLMGCSAGGDTTAKPTPTAPTVQYVDYDLKIPAEALNSPTIGPLSGDTKLHVLITFKANQDELKKLKDLKQKSDQNVDLSQEANKIGITDEQYAQIKKYLGVDGLTLKLDTLHTNLTVDGKASLFEVLLQTSFVQHKLKDGRVFFAPKTAPKIPSFMKDRVVAINGLDNYSKPPMGHSNLLKSAQKISTNKTANNCGVSPEVLNNQQVAHAYGFDSFWEKGYKGKGMVVNLVELEGFNETDAQTYFDCVGYNGNVKVINVDQPPTPGEDVGESTLDIDMIAGLAPEADMNIYQGVDPVDGSTSWSTFNHILAQIVNDNSGKHAPSVVSISWGGAEEYLTEEVFNAMSANLQLLTDAEHMTVFVASMDCGAFAIREWNHLGVSYPASDPYATAVGGTILNTDAQGNRTSEVVWQDGSDKSKCENQWGSGGGLSTAFDQPNYDTVSGMQNKYSDGHRQVPDISAVAFNLAVFYRGEWYTFLGTSAATPIWAAGLAVVNQALIASDKVYGYGTGLFYMVAKAQQSSSGPSFFDVTQGDNLYYPATQGWDYATGLGTPNLMNFYLTLQALVRES